MLTLPSSLRLGAPHLERVCVELLRKRAKAKMKVEVFKRNDVPNIAQHWRVAPQSAQSPEEFEIVKDTSFSKVGERSKCFVCTLISETFIASDI